MASIKALAAAPGGDRGFDHAHTGFPITGVHATTPCETCHIGGVFIGTPRACDGCHAVGKRVVATPKSTSHIVTDAPCDTCHFNTSTFYGARFNHGTAMPGQCTNCHNGRIVEGTPRNHPVSPIAGASCDSCHRSSSWLPASWNHTNTASDCSFCHKAGGPGRNYAAGHLPMSMDTVSFTGNCRACHTNYYTFYSTYYNHAGASTSCGNCHQNAAYGPGVKQITSTAAHNVYSANAGITQCQSCHKSYGVGTFAAGRYDHATGATCDTCHKTANSPYIRAMAANHIPIATTASCNSCHTSTANWASVAMQHNTTQIALTPCKTCHLGSPRYIGNMETRSYGHKGFNSSQDCISCHTQQYNRWNEP